MELFCFVFHSLACSVTPVLLPCMIEWRYYALNIQLNPSLYFRSIAYFLESWIMDLFCCCCRTRVMRPSPWIVCRASSCCRPKEAASGWSTPRNSRPMRWASPPSLHAPPLLPLPPLTCAFSFQILEANPSILLPGMWPASSSRLSPNWIWKLHTHSNFCTFLWNFFST